jgi:hypothetical protein
LRHIPSITEATDKMNSVKITLLPLTALLKEG